MSNQNTQEINRAIQEMTEIMLKAILTLFKDIAKQQEFSQQLRQEMMMQCAHEVGKEMGKQMAMQFREQMKEVKISTLQFTDQTGKEAQSLLAHDSKGKEYQLDQITENGKLSLVPIDGKGGPVELEVQELNLPAKEERLLLAVSDWMSKVQEKLLQLMQTIRSGMEKTVDTFFRETQKNLVVGDKIFLEKLKDDHKSLADKEIDIKDRLDRVQDTLKDLEQKKEVIGLKDWNEKRKGLERQQEDLHGQLANCQQHRKGKDQLLTQKLHKHCPELTKETLHQMSFNEKTALAHTAFEHPHDLTLDRLEDHMREKGDHKGLEAMDRFKELDRGMDDRFQK